MSILEERPRSGADFIRQFFPNSPYVSHLGMRLDDIQPGMARLSLPFTDKLVTIGTIVHGGAIASLIDTAAMVRDGHTFYCSANGVWLVDSVPATYLRVVE